jgi:hypothetical protein
MRAAAAPAAQRSGDSAACALLFCYVFYARACMMKAYSSASAPLASAS